MLEDNNFGFQASLIDTIRTKLTQKQVQADDTNCELFNTESQLKLPNEVPVVPENVITTVGPTITKQSTTSSKEYFDANPGESSLDDIDFVSADEQLDSQKSLSNVIDPLCSQGIPLATPRSPRSLSLIDFVRSFTPTSPPSINSSSNQTIIESQTSKHPAITNYNLSPRDSEINAEIDKINGIEPEKTTFTSISLMTPAHVIEVPQKIGDDTSAAVRAEITLMSDSLSVETRMKRICGSSGESDDDDAQPEIEQQFITEDFLPENVPFASTQNFTTPKKSDKMVAMKSRKLISPIKKIDLFSQVAEADSSQEIDSNGSNNSGHLIIDESRNRSKAKKSNSRKKPEEPRKSKFDELFKLDSVTLSKMKSTKVKLEESILFGMKLNLPCDQTI